MIPSFLWGLPITTFADIFLNTPFPPHPSGWCIPVSWPWSGFVHTQHVHGRMWAGDAQIPVFFLLHLPACWTPFLGDLLRHGWTHLGPSQAPPNVPKGSTPCSPPNRLHPHVPYSHPPSLQAMNPESFSGHSTQLPKCLSTPSHPLPRSHCPFSGLGTHS